MEILVSRFTKISSLINRIRRLFIAYNIVPFSSLKKNIECIKVNELNEI
jgi:hypothetical protein